MLMYQLHFVHCLGKMLHVCVLGHSLVPTFILLNSSTVQLEILRYPGATITSLTDKLTDLDFGPDITTVQFFVLVVMT